MAEIQVVKQNASTLCLFVRLNATEIVTYFEKQWEYLTRYYKLWLKEVEMYVYDLYDL